MSASKLPLAVFCALLTSGAAAAQGQPAAAPPGATAKAPPPTASVPTGTSAPQTVQPAEEAPAPGGVGLVLPAQIDGAKIVSRLGPPLLPDGRAVPDEVLASGRTVCGVVQSVVIDVKGTLERAEVRVPCVTRNGAAVPGGPVLKRAKKAPTVVVKQPTEKPEDPGKPGAQGPGEASASPGTPAPDTKTEGADKAASGAPKLESDGLPPAPFYKGELTRMGSTRFANAKQFVGVGVGVETIGGVVFLNLNPDVNLQFGKFQLGLGAPIRLELADANKLVLNDQDTYAEATKNQWRIRGKDWDELSDFLRPIRHIRWGRKEDHLYVNLSRLDAHTVGHGQLMRRYTPNLNFDQSNLFAEADGYLDFGGVELVAGPLPVPSVFGGLAFIKPIGPFFDHYFAKSLSFGVSYLTDVAAPTSLQQRDDPDNPGTTQLAVSPTNQFVATTAGVQGWGVDAEFKAYKNSFLDVKVYGDYSQLLLPAYDSNPAAADGGFTLGTIIRMSWGKRFAKHHSDETPDAIANPALRELRAAHALRFRLEGRTFGAQYLPSYFDTMYEATKYQFGSSLAAARTLLPTKLGYLSSQKGQDQRVGHYVELSYNLVDWFGVTAMYEDAFATGGFTPVSQARNVALHAETGGLGWLQLFATYHYRNFEDFSGFMQFNSDNELFFLGGRLQVLPILFINVTAQRAFQVAYGTGESGLLRDDNDLAYTSLGLRNDWRAAVDVQLGFQF